jgi:Uncharacterized protein conserved in bacteria
VVVDIKRYHDLADLVLDLEVLMRESGAWECPVPTDEALQSTIPFAADSMAFNQWIRYIMVPRFKVIIEDGGVLPHSSNIADYASEANLEISQEGQRKIVHCIRMIDQLLNQRMS